MEQHIREEMAKLEPTNAIEFIFEQLCNQTIVLREIRGILQLILERTGADYTMRRERIEAMQE